MLISCEGQDGTGKTSLLRATFTELTRRGIRASTVDEFSTSPYGQRLIEALTRDKVLRPVPGEPATRVTRAFDVVADLYYFDERVIGPALRAGYVVLKDRHLDTVFSTLVPALARSGPPEAEDRMFGWLNAVVSELRHKPAVTVYADAPLDVRRARIKDRAQRLVEARANKVDGDDLAVFAARERLMRRLIAQEPARFMTIENGRVPLDEGVKQILARIDSQRSGTP